MTKINEDKLKEHKKLLLQFKKVFKKDLVKGLDLCEQILKLATQMKNYEGLKEKQIEAVKREIDTLKLYKSNVKGILHLKSKYTDKKEDKNEN